ncbi:MAG: Mut7-C RNAse domain-containing protein, partial [Planctomycetota bacterium]
QWRVSGIHVIETEAPMAQLREVEAVFGICRDARPFTRCSRCNTGLHAVARDEVKGEIPPRVLLGHERFLRCPRCRRVYWDGSHVDRIRRALGRVLPASLTARHPS